MNFGMIIKCYAENQEMLTYMIETEYDSKNSMLCGECKETMINSYFMGIKTKMCINENCSKNNNDRNYCHCEHQHFQHERTFGVCVEKDCLCDAWYFMCTPEVWDAWH